MNPINDRKQVLLWKVNLILEAFLPAGNVVGSVRRNQAFVNPYTSSVFQAGAIVTLSNSEVFCPGEVLRKWRKYKGLEVEK